MASDFDTAQAMMKYGGSFVQKLGALVSVADAENLRRIKATWPVYWEEYTKIAKATADKVSR